MSFKDLKIHFRFIGKNPFHTIVNVLGLSSAISLSLLLFFYCFHELNYDRFHSKASNVYLLRMDYISNGEVIFGMYPPTPVYDLLKNQFSQITSATRVYIEKETSLQHEADVFREGKLLKVDADFFKIFDFKVRPGKNNAIFESPKSIFISDEIAKKYFSDGQIEGKTLKLAGKDEYSVAGVVHIPTNSSIQFDFIISTLPSDSITWQFGVVAPIYFESKTQNDAKNALLKMQVAIDQHYGEGSYKLELVPLLEQYFHNNLDYALHGNRNYVNIFIALNIVILILSVINYFNLATAQSLKRSKEIGIRKVVGANRYQLIRQHLLESALLVAISMGLSILFVFLSMPSFKTLIGKEISIMSFNLLGVACFLILFFIILTFLSGSYPALWITKQQPVNALRNKIKGIGSLGLWLRKSMMVFQFTVSSLFITMTLIMQAQMDFMMDQKLGFEKDQILRLKISNVSGSQNDAINSYSVIKKELLEVQGVSGVTVCPMPDYDANFEGIYNDNGEERSTNAFIYKVDEDFLNVLGVKLIAGRNLDAANPKEGILINQTAAKLFFEGDPIGMQNKMLSKKKVLGVVNDFHFNGIKTDVQPLILEHYTKTFTSIQLKVDPNNIRETIAKVKRVWSKYAPGQVFEFSFLNEDYNRLYLNESRIAEIFTIFCFASIIIACLGLIGMASYSLKNLQKDLSIRRVFGASSLDNLILILTIFFKPIIVSILISIPFALKFSALYLEDFAYKIDFSLPLFLIGILTIIVLVLASIGFQSLKAANMNPLNYIKEQ